MQLAPLFAIFRPRLTLILALGMALVTTACVGKKQDTPSGPIQIKIPLLTDGTYQFQVVDLLSVDDLVELKGWAARFLISPNQVESRLQGYAPKIRSVKNAAGVYIATDELSLQLLTIYYHLENLGMMDELAGVKDINSWPRTVAVNVNYIAKNGNGNRTENNALYSGDLDALLFVPYTESSLPIMVNGGIIGHEHFHSLFQKLFVKPLGSKYPGVRTNLHGDQEHQMKLAMGFPVGVVVPESLPENPTPSPEPEDENTPKAEMSERLPAPMKSKESDKSADRSSDRGQDDTDSFGTKSIVGADDYHSYLLRGLNEGLADFWGWLYSSDIDFVGQSLPQFSTQRKLEGIDSIPSDYCFSLSLTYSAQRDKEYPGPVAKAYRYGTNVARNLKAFALDYQKKRNLTQTQLRAQLGSAVLRSVVSLKEAYIQLSETDAVASGKTLGTNQFFEILSNQLEGLSTEEVAVLKPANNPAEKVRILCK